jgi:hypothetical protein
MIVGGVVAASVTVSGCNATQPARGGSAAAGTLVMIIRHGEKPDSSHAGVGFDGRPAGNGSLTQVGWDRARALVEVFAPSGGRFRPGLERPALIYAAGANEGGSGERARETVMPLAQRLGVTVNTEFGKGEEHALAARIVTQPRPTLICWQHGEIPAIAEAFGSLTPSPPAAWPSRRFDVIWTLTARGGGWDFVQLPEMVLPGDQPDPIAN